MLDNARKKLVPHASRMAINALAFDVMRAERAATKDIFAHPRPFTQRAFMVEQAKSNVDPEAVVHARPEAERYLEPYEFGGTHVLPGTALLNPKDIKLDQYGQLPKDIMDKLKGRPDIYIGTIRGIKGVWQRMNINRAGKTRRKYQRGKAYTPEQGAVQLLIRFGDALQVTKHLNFEARAIAVVGANFMSAFRAALAKAGK